jgi:hypothetical protein
MYHKIQIKFDYGEIDIYCSWIMALFLLEDRDFMYINFDLPGDITPIVTPVHFSQHSFIASVFPSYVL